MLEKGKFYFLKIKLFGREVEYEGQIVYLDDNEFGIKTEDDCDLRFKLSSMFYHREIEEKKPENRIVVRKNGPLQEADIPGGL